MIIAKAVIHNVPAINDKKPKAFFIGCQVEEKSSSPKGLASRIGMARIYKAAIINGTNIVARRVKKPIPVLANRFLFLRLFRTRTARSSPVIPADISIEFDQFFFKPDFWQSDIACFIHKILTITQDPVDKVFY